MIIPDNIKCVICSRIFCCPNCRKLHEEREHAVEDKENIHKSCFICHGKPHPLKKVNSELLMEHILDAHLPLHCRKCNKIYNSKDDFHEIEKCVGAGNIPKTPTIPEDEAEDDKENVQPTKDQTLPTHKIIVEEVDEALLTPLTKINLKWRRKSAGFANTTSDHSVSASVSAIAHPNQSQLKINPDSGSKLVRTTSTPMNQVFLTKPGSLDSLCGSSYQASSIDHTSGMETDQSASNSSCSPSPAVVIKRTQFQLQRTKQLRNRLPKAQTPLRQVMSKSIQRALIEQRAERTKLLQKVGMPRKMIFDSMSSSDGSIDEPAFSSTKSPGNSGVLDLRTTPVLKRTNSAPLSRSKRQSIVVRKKVSEESLMVEALLDENYLQSDFRAKIEAISDNVINETKYEEGIAPIPLTPDIDSTPFNNNNSDEICFKSCMDDKTPVKKSAIVTPMPQNLPVVDDSFANEIFYSPKNVSRSFNTQFAEVSESESGDDDVFTANKDEEIAKEPPNRLWKLFSSVMRMATGSLNEEPRRSPPKQSIVKRSLSHLGLIAKRPMASPRPHLKRKRKTSSQTSTNSEQGAVIPELRSPLAKKYKSITGRKPISRMQSK
ncbi:mitosis initiation protein fs(1)Ya [Culicoides brevitarsis]|uniref:mitosis initiation protein fs(1)Ya n=1 Tax=Culicoides brevitarsis TaxID=469753 RepID=UPI00307C056B